MITFRFARRCALLGLVALTCSLPVLHAAPAYLGADKALERELEQGHHRWDPLTSHPDDSNIDRAEMPVPQSPAPFGVVDSTKGSFEYRPQETGSSSANAWNDFGHSVGAQTVGPSRRYDAPASEQGFDQQAPTFGHPGRGPMDAYPHNDRIGWESDGRQMQQGGGSNSQLGAGQRMGPSLDSIETLDDLYSVFGLRREEDQNWEHDGHPQGSNVQHPSWDESAQLWRSTLEHPQAPSAQPIDARYRQPETYVTIPTPGTGVPARPARKERNRMPAAEPRKRDRSKVEEEPDPVKLLSDQSQARAKADRYALAQIRERYHASMRGKTDVLDWLKDIPDNKLWEVANYVFSADGAIDQAQTLLKRPFEKIAINDVWSMSIATAVQQDVVLTLLQRNPWLVNPKVPVNHYGMMRLEDGVLPVATVRRWRQTAEKTEQARAAIFHLGSYRVKVFSIAIPMDSLDTTYQRVVAIPTEPGLSPIYLGYLTYPKTDTAQHSQRYRDRLKNGRERAALAESSGRR